MWGLSIQNEPMAKQTWESCIYTTKEKTRPQEIPRTHHAQGRFGRQEYYYVGPQPRPDLSACPDLFFSTRSGKVRLGDGFHWYEDWSGGLPVFENVRRVHEAFPEENILFTEGCAESFDATRYNFWGLGEEYGRAMIHDFNNGSVGWTDWNILLDELRHSAYSRLFCRPSTEIPKP